MTDDRAMDLHQFGAYTESIDMGPVCLCARQSAGRLAAGTDLSAPFGPVPPASQAQGTRTEDTLRGLYSAFA